MMTSEDILYQKNTNKFLLNLHATDNNMIYHLTNYFLNVLINWLQNWFQNYFSFFMTGFFRTFPGTMRTYIFPVDFLILYLIFLMSKRQELDPIYYTSLFVELYLAICHFSYLTGIFIPYVSVMQ